MAEWDGGYRQNPAIKARSDRKDVDEASRERRAKAADVTLEYLRMLKESGQPLPDFDTFLDMQERQKRQLRPHGELEDAAPPHKERDEEDNGQQ